MSKEANLQLRLRPEHLRTLAGFGAGRVIGAQVCRDGRFEAPGFELYGRLEVLANCGLVEVLAQDGKRHVPPGDVVIYYYLTDRGRDLLRWRVSEPPPGLNPRTPGPRYDGSAAGHLPARW